jgi:hypothetical protein
MEKIYNLTIVYNEETEEIEFIEETIEVASDEPQPTAQIPLTYSTDDSQEDVVQLLMQMILDGSIGIS